MPIELAELRESRSVSGGSVTLNFRLTGTTDDVIAYNYLLDNTSETYAGWIRERKPSIEPEHIDTVTDVGSWKCSVRYVVPDQKEVIESEVDSIRIRGTTKGGTQHLVTSLQTVGAYGTGAGTDDNGKLIDITDSSHEFAEIYDGESTYLVSSPTGSARIIWAQPGTGLLWALVRLGDGASGGGSGITVEDVGEMPIDDVTHLTFEHIDVSDEGSGEVKISLPDGGPEMFGLLGWNSYDKKWIKACDGPGMGYPQQLYVDANETISWKDAHFKALEVDGSVHMGISALVIHHNTAGDASGPILVQSTSSGTHPERTAELTISHSPIFASSQNIEVRNAAGTGTTTLRFDKYGHFIGTS